MIALISNCSGVSGGTASGKTTVCDMIIQQLHDHRVVLVNQVSCQFSFSSCHFCFLSPSKIFFFKGMQCFCFDLLHVVHEFPPLYLRRTCTQCVCVLPLFVMRYCYYTLHLTINAITFILLFLPHISVNKIIRRFNLFSTILQCSFFSLDTPSLNWILSSLWSLCRIPFTEVWHQKN